MTDLAGGAAQTLGVVLARATRKVQEVTGAELVYLYVFGRRIPHLHFHRAPQEAGDPLNTEILARDAPPIPEPRLRDLADRLRGALASSRSPGGPRA